MPDGTGERSTDAMANLIGNEEELIQLRQENQALREQADLLEETSSVLQEQIGLKDQSIAALQRETMLLTQQVQEIQERLEKDGDGYPMSPTSVRFSRPPKSLRKKSTRRK